MTPLAALATFLSGLAAWQTICGVETAAAALAKIHWPVLDLADLEPAERRALRPAMVLAVADGGGARRIAHPNTWSDSLTIFAGLWVLPDDDYADRKDQYIAFGNAIGTLEDEIRAASGIGGPNIVEIRRLTGPRRTAKHDVGKTVLDEFTIEYELTLEAGE